jgi:hypothetical protein
MTLKAMKPRSEIARYCAHQRKTAALKPRLPALNTIKNTIVSI